MASRSKGHATNLLVARPQWNDELGLAGPLAGNEGWIRVGSSIKEKCCSCLQAKAIAKNQTSGWRRMRAITLVVDCASLAGSVHDGLRVRHEQPAASLVLQPGGVAAPVRRSSPPSSSRTETL